MADRTVDTELEPSQNGRPSTERELGHLTVMAQPPGDAPVGRAEATNNSTLNHNPFYVTSHQTVLDGERPGAAGARARDGEDSPRGLLRAIAYASPTGTSDDSSMPDSAPSPQFCRFNLALRRTRG